MARNNAAVSVPATAASLAVVPPTPPVGLPPVTYVATPTYAPGQGMQKMSWVNQLFQQPTPLGR
jgi:hypothetical protein